MRVLLVDHDSEALETVTRAIRGVLELDCVTSKGDALLLLRQNTYDVLIACERCVDGSGLDLLGRTTRTAVPLKRIFAAAPERLQLLGPRLAPFKVQRTINYPIDLEELWLAIAQVTSGPEDETDGTIERVVLDERGIPSTGTMPRVPIPPRPPAPLAEVVPTPVIATSLGRAASARLTQPAPEPPLRAPPPPRQPPPVARAPAPVAAPAPPRTTSDTGRMRAPLPPNTTSDTGRMRAPLPPNTISDTGRMRAMAPPAPPPAQSTAPIAASGVDDFPPWTPEVPADDFEQIALQARLGVQQKVVDQVARRRRQRIFAAGGIAVVVAGAIVFLIENFYDPQARAREAAIAASVEQMSQQQKVTDSLTLIEIDIENAIMNNDLDKARREMAELVEKAPNHPRREFLQASIDRAAELAKLSPQTTEKQDKQPAPAAVLAAAAERPTANKPRPAEQVPERAPERVARLPDRPATSHNLRDTAPPSQGQAPRTYGAPIGDVPQQSIPLNAPINSSPVTTLRHPDNAFTGRTVEASDAGFGRSAPPSATPAPALTRSVVQAPASAAGSAVAPMPSAAPAAAPAPPPVIEVVPAKILKRIIPVPPAGLARGRDKGYVVVKFNIGVNGRVSELEVVESEPQGVFDAAAQDAVRKWVYEPRKENGVAVESSARARLVFDPSN